MATQFPSVPDYYPDHPNLLRKMLLVMKNMIQGRTNNAYTVTLTANSATTTVQMAKNDLGQETLIFFMPQTANASAEIGAGAMYVSARSILADPPTFTITHANNAQTDRTFGFILVG